MPQQPESSISKSSPSFLSSASSSSKRHDVRRGGSASARSPCGASFGGRKSGAFFSRNSLRMKVFAESRLASSSIGKRLMQLVAEDRHAARLQPDDRRARLDLGPERVEDLAQQPLGRVEHAEVVERPAAAERLPRARRPGSPAASSTSTAAIAVCGWKWLLNVSGQRMTRGVPDVPRRGRRRHQSLNVSVANGGHLPPGRDPAQALGAACRRPAACVISVRRPRRHRREPRPPVDPAHRVGVPGPQPALVVVREELGLVGGHVDVHRALGLASLARQAEVERLADRLALPALLHRVALEHLEEQVRPAAGRVHLLLGDHVARAHRPVLLLAALADATQRSVA